MAIGVVTKKDYAEHRGCSPSYVSKMIRFGKLAAPALLADGRINVVLADQMLGSVSANDQLFVRSATLPGPVYAQERARREAAVARLREIDLARREGEQVPRAVIGAAATNVFGRAVAAFYEIWPDLSVELARLTDPAAIAELGQRRTRAVMAGLTEEFLADVGRRAAG